MELRGLLAEARCVVLEALSAVGLVERTDDEVCDERICAVLNVERWIGRGIDVGHGSVRGHWCLS
jgi:hypothetical protein